jgi:UDP-N-acetylmuramate--alanine ligase
MIDRLGLRRDGRRLLTYGTAADADLLLRAARQEGFSTIFDAELRSRVAGGARKLDGWRIPIPGQHNALNALAAIAVAAEARIPDNVIRGAIESFSGVKRRFQRTGTWNGIAVFDDYAHHPVEIAAVLKAARHGTRGHVIAVIEPHRYTRVRDLYAEFCACLSDADSVIVAPLYSAGETPIDGLDSEALADGMRRAGHPSVFAVDSPDAIAPLLRRHARAGDVVIFLGAGNSTEWAHELPALLAEQPKRAGGAM